jgi:hypothetical protein
MEADILVVSETSDTNSTLAQLIALEGPIADKHPNNTPCYEARWTATQLIRAARIMKPEQTCPELYG